MRERTRKREKEREKKKGMVTGERKHCFIFPLFEEKLNSVLSPQGVRAVQELLFLLNLLPFICRHPLRSWEGGQDLQPWPSYSGDIAFIINAKKKNHPNCVREFLMKAWVKTVSMGGGDGVEISRAGFYCQNKEH